MALAGLKLHWLVAIVVTSILLVATTPTCEGQTSLFIFGDSYFEVGNNIYINTTTGFLANFPPYGETFFHYPTGRFCDGRIISDFIAEYANLPVIPPYLQPGNHEFEYGANFASSGAGALLGTYRGRVIDLKTQVSYLRNVKEKLVQKLGEEKAKEIVSDAVYLISIGTNDYLKPYVTKKSASVFNSSSLIVQYVDNVIGNLTTTIKEIYNEGGRKFGLLNVGPLGCSPYARFLNPQKPGNCIDQLTLLVNLHNDALSKIPQNLEKELNGFVFSEFNFNVAATERMNNPNNYGFTEGKSACCGSGPYNGDTSCGGKRGSSIYELCPDPSENVYFDFVHPTENAARQFSELMWSGDIDIDVVRPYNFKQLFEYGRQASYSI